METLQAMGKPTILTISAINLFQEKVVW